MKRIVLTGGGTAGHVSPNQALIPHLLEDGWEIHYIGTQNGIERSLIEPMHGVTYHAVQSGKLRRYFDLRNFTDPFRVIAGAVQSFGIISKLKPNVIFSKGGFVSVPVVFGGALCGVPVVMHESDITPAWPTNCASRLPGPCAPLFPNAQSCWAPKACRPARLCVRRSSQARASGASSWPDSAEANRC